MTQERLLIVEATNRQLLDSLHKVSIMLGQIDVTMKGVEKKSDAIAGSGCRRRFGRIPFETFTKECRKRNRSLVLSQSSDNTFIDLVVSPQQVSIRHSCKFRFIDTICLLKYLIF